MDEIRRLNIRNPLMVAKRLYWNWDYRHHLPIQSWSCIQRTQLVNAKRNYRYVGHMRTVSQLTFRLCCSCVSIFFTFFPLYRLTFSGYMHFSLIEALTSKLSTNLFLYSNFWICHFFHFFIHTNTYIHATMPPICPLDIIHTQPQSQNEHTDTRECRCMLSALVLRWKITWR